MIDPNDVLFASPIFDGRPQIRWVTGLLQLVAARLIRAPYFLVGCSDIVRARNKIAHWAIKHRFGQLVMVDSDIAWTMQDWEYLMDDADGADAVCCEYSAKVVPPRPAQWGMGFCRISLALLERMSRHQVPIDGGSTRLLPRYFEDDTEYVHFFRSGVIEPGRYRAEDQAFWLLANSIGAKIRYEQRTRLVHIGTGDYAYDGLAVGDPPAMRAPGETSSARRK